MTIQKLFHDIRGKLTPASGDLARHDAEEIIQRSLNITRARLYTDMSIDVNSDDLARIDMVVKRRIEGEPLQYIFGTAFFYDREFIVNKDVLIPRPDTEVLIETVLKSETSDKKIFMDIGTGSGIIPAILTKHRPDWRGVAVDVSHKSLQTASRNICNDADLSSDDHPSNTINLICCDMLSSIKPNKRFDFIVSNPPYIPSSKVSTLDKSVSCYEPRAALDGGADGLFFYRAISERAKMYLIDTGRVYLEIGYDQGESVPAIFRDDGWSDIAVIKDLGGRDRVAIINL